MTAHILVPAFDAENCSTLSSKTLDYLREKMGFQGVIVADSLVMEGVLRKCGSVDEASIAALNAGCDLLILGGKLLSGQAGGFELTASDIQRVAGSLVHAVKCGRISEARLDQAVDRILRLKERYAGSDSSGEINSAEHRAIGEKIASLALQTIVKQPIASLSEKNVIVFAPQLVRNHILNTSLLSIGKENDSFFFKALDPSNLESAEAQERAEAADVIVFCSYNAWRNEAQSNLIRALLDRGKPMILVTLRDPLDASLFQEADVVINAFSPTTPSIRAICECLDHF